MLSCTVSMGFWGELGTVSLLFSFCCAASVWDWQHRYGPTPHHLTKDTSWGPPKQRHHQRAANWYSHLSVPASCTLCKPWLSLGPSCPCASENKGEKKYSKNNIDWEKFALIYIKTISPNLSVQECPLHLKSACEFTFTEFRNSFFQKRRKSFFCNEVTYFHFPILFLAW